MTRTRIGFAFVPLLAWLVGCDGPASRPHGGTHPPAPAPSPASALVLAPVPSPAPVLELAPLPRERVHLEVTPAAARELRAHVAERQLQQWWLRYTITSGGCIGFQSKLDLELGPLAGEDFEFVADGIPCVMLRWQRPYARGTRIDFSEKDGERGFIITFPQGTSCPQNAVGRPITDEFAERATGRPVQPK